MKAWDIFSWQAPGVPEPHPAVIVSHLDRVANRHEASRIYATTAECATFASFSICSYRCSSTGMKSVQRQFSWIPDRLRTLGG